MNELKSALIEINSFIEKNESKNYMVRILKRKVPNLKFLINKYFPEPKIGLLVVNEDGTTEEYEDAKEYFKNKG